MASVREWCRASARYARKCGQALPGLRGAWARVVAVLVYLGIIAAGAITAATTNHVWPNGVVAVLAAALLVTVVEGVRRERKDMRAEEVNLELTVLPGTWFPTDPGFMQYGVRVTNNGPDGRFNAAVVSDVKGATAALPYGHFEIAWEGTAEVEPLLLHGRTRHAVLGTYIPAIRGFRFRVPPSPHSGGQFYEDGPSQEMQHDRWRLEFELEVRDVERGVGCQRSLRVAFATPGAECPVLSEATSAWA